MSESTPPNQATPATESILCLRSLQQIYHNCEAESDVIRFTLCSQNQLEDELEEKEDPPSVSPSPSSSSSFSVPIGFSLVPGSVFEVYGASQTGKTEYLYELTLNTVLPSSYHSLALDGANQKCIFIDADQRFQFLRFQQKFKHRVRNSVKKSINHTQMEKRSATRGRGVSSGGVMDSRDEENEIELAVRDYFQSKQYRHLERLVFSRVVLVQVSSAEELVRAVTGANLMIKQEKARKKRRENENQGERQVENGEKLPAAAGISGVDITTSLPNPAPRLLYQEGSDQHSHFRSLFSPPAPSATSDFTSTESRYDSSASSHAHYTPPTPFMRFSPTLSPTPVPFPSSSSSSSFSSSLSGPPPESISVHSNSNSHRRRRRISSSGIDCDFGLVVVDNIGIYNYWIQKDQKIQKEKAAEKQREKKAAAAAAAAEATAATGATATAEEKTPLSTSTWTSVSTTLPTPPSHLPFISTPSTLSFSTPLTPTPFTTLSSTATPITSTSSISAPRSLFDSFSSSLSHLLSSHHLCCIVSKPILTSYYYDLMMSSFQHHEYLNKKWNDLVSWRLILREEKNGQGRTKEGGKIMEGRLSHFPGKGKSHKNGKGKGGELGRSNETPTNLYFRYTIVESGVVRID